MSNKFVSILDEVGHGIKWFFTNKTAENIEQEGIALTEVAFPALDPLLGGLSKSLATAQGLAANINTTGDTTAQVAAIVVADAQSVFQAYGAAQNPPVTLETDNQKAIVQAFINLIKVIPSPATAATGSSTAVPAVPGLGSVKVTNVQTEAATGTLL